MVVTGAMLADELRRRRAKPRSLAASLEGVRSHRTRVLGDLRTTPTSILVLAALSLTPDSRRRASG